jgi:hypothetical protein
MPNISHSKVPRLKMAFVLVDEQARVELSHLELYTEAAREHQE